MTQISLTKRAPEHAQSSSAPIGGGAHLDAFHQGDIKGAFDTIRIVHSRDVPYIWPAWV